MSGERIDDGLTQSGKVSGALLGSGDGEGLGAGGAALFTALVRAEEERPILTDGTANRTAVLISAERLLGGIEEIPRIELVVAQEFEGGAMQALVPERVESWTTAPAPDSRALKFED